MPTHAQPSSAGDQPAPTTHPVIQDVDSSRTRVSTCVTDHPPCHTPTPAAVPNLVLLWDKHHTLWPHRASEGVLGALAAQLQPCLGPHARAVASSAFMFVLGRPAPSSLRPPSPPAGSSGAFGGSSGAFGGSRPAPMGCQWGAPPGLTSCQGSMPSAVRPESGLGASGSLGLGLSLTSPHTGTDCVAHLAAVLSLETQTPILGPRGLGRWKACAALNP